MVITEFLRGFPPFQDLKEDEIRAIASISVERRILMGAQIIQEGDQALSLFIIRSGSVDVFKGVEKDHSSCVSHLITNEMFGEMAFVERCRTTAHVIAHEDSDLLELPFCDLQRLIDSNGVIGMKLYRILSIGISNKLKLTTERLLAQILSSPLIELGQMAMSIGHEINNPLAELELRLEQMHDMVHEEGSELVGLVPDIDASRKAIDRITKIVKGLKLVGRNSQSDPIMQVDLRHLIQETLEFCSHRFRAGNVSLEIGSIPEGVLLSCRSVQISQVLLNLLNNAYEATSRLSEKWVKVSVEVVGGTIRISVTDSGAGIPHEIQSKLFQVFFTTKPPGNGTGLGLCVSKRIIESHGGSLAVEPSSRNTCFLIQIPVRS